jgi:hypothetical protein
MSKFVDGQRQVQFGEGALTRASGAYDPETGALRQPNVPRFAANRIPVNIWKPKIFFSHDPGLTKMRYDSSQDPLNNLVDRKVAFQTAFPEFTKINLGTSFQSRPIDAYLLGPRSRKHFVIANAIHGNEIDGVEGSFKAMEILARETEFQSFRDEWSILFVPALNPDGWFLGTRNLAQIGPNTKTINLNRNWDWFWDEYVESDFESKGASAESTAEALSILNYLRGTGPFSGQGAAQFGFVMDLHSNQGVGKRYQSRDRIWREIDSPPGVVPPGGIIPDSYIATYIDLYIWRMVSMLTAKRVRDHGGPDYAISYRRSRFRPHMHAYFSSIGIPTIAVEELKVANAGGRETYATAADYRVDYILGSAALATSDFWEFKDALLIEKGGRNVLKNSQFEQWQPQDERPGNYTMSRVTAQRNTHVPEIQPAPEGKIHFDDSGEAVELLSQTDIVLPTASEFTRPANISPQKGTGGPGRYAAVLAASAELFRFDNDETFSAGAVPGFTITHSQRIGVGTAFALQDAIDLIGGGTAAPSTGATRNISRITDVSDDVAIAEALFTNALNTARMFHAVCDNFLANPNGGDQRAYIFGGFDGVGTRLTSIETWNPNTQLSANEVAVLTTATAEATAVYYPPTDRVYIYGGSTGAAAAVNTLYQYDITLDSIVVQSPTGDTVPALKHSAGVYNPRDQKIWFFGGEDISGNMSGNIYTYDPATNVWTLESIPHNLDDDEDAHDTEDDQPEGATWSIPLGRWGGVSFVEQEGDTDGVVHILGGRLTSAAGAVQEEVYLFDTVDEIIGLARLSDYGYLRYSVAAAEREYEAGTLGTADGTRAIKVTAITGRSYINSNLTFSPSGVTGEFLELTKNAAGEDLLRVKELDGTPDVGDTVTADSSAEDLVATVASLPVDNFASALDETNQWEDLSGVWLFESANFITPTEGGADRGILRLRNGIDWENNIVVVGLALDGTEQAEPFDLLLRAVISGGVLVDGYRIQYDPGPPLTWRLLRRNASTFVAALPSTLDGPYNLDSVDPASSTFDIAVDGGGPQTITFAATDPLIEDFRAATPTEVIAVINDQIVGATASLGLNGEMLITSDSTGTGSSLDLDPGATNDANLVFGFSTTLVSFSETELASLDVAADATRQVISTSRDLLVTVEDQDPVRFDVTFNSLSIFTGVLDTDVGRIRDPGEVAVEGGR